jgi:hypothetical protein
MAHVSDFINLSAFSQIFSFSFQNIRNIIFYYFLLLFNNKYAFILYIVFFNLIYSLCNPNNTLYCMDDINDNVSSPESDHNSGFKKRKYIENLNVSNLNNYYEITDSHNINSVLENGDLITIFQNNPYLKLEGILFITLGIILYGLIALSIINILSKYSSNLNNYFKNKYILMYINLNRKYLNILTWVWIVILFFSVILCLIISYVLIDTYDIYCLQSPYYK